LTAGPLRLDGNEGPLMRTSSKALRPKSTDVFRQFLYPHVASQRDLERPVMSATTTTRPRRTGVRTELARYALPTIGERVIYGQRVDGRVRVTDNPARGRGRAYLIERKLEQDGNAALQALIADYIAQSEILQAIPMAPLAT
jgi:hypothetical protein